MPWKTSTPVNERMKFVTRLLDGERMTDLCKKFEISRKTGYKLLERFKELGPEAFEDLSRRPRHSPAQTPQEKVDLILDLRVRHPSWGPKKLKDVLEYRHPGVAVPAASTIGAILKRNDMVEPRKRRKRVWPSPTPLRDSTAPNEIWAIDYKGHFRLKNGRYCYPLTVTDHFSRYLVVCEALESTKSGPAMATLEGVFRSYGLPKVIRSDNGAPFASTGRFGLSCLSVWLMRLGIGLERIEPGHPEQNGRHERMHLTLKKESTRPAAANFLQQQERFDAFQDTYNQERPHEALGMRRPATVYQPSSRPYVAADEPLIYPCHDLTTRVHRNGHMYFRPLERSIYVGLAFAHEYVGLRQLCDHTWLVSFMNLDLGYVDMATQQLLPIDPPTDLSPMSPV